MADRLTWVFRAHSEIGLVRKMNQDSGFVGRHLVLVADGMGGAAAGDLASAVAVDVIRHVDDRVEPATDAGAASTAGTAGTASAEDRYRRNTDLLATAIAEANGRIADLVAADYALEGMGTTVTGGILDEDQLTLAHLGDSRAYLFRDGRLERLTHDHSWVQSLIDDGKISEAEAAIHPHRSLLLKVLNGQPANDPDVTRVPLRAGDRLLLCSDGLCGFVEDEQITVALADADPDAVMASLVADAHQAGGADNITIILVDLSEPPEPAGGLAPAGTTAAAAGSLPVVLGAAAEREIPSDDTMVRGRPQPGISPTGSGGGTGGDLDEEDDLDDEDRYAPQPPSRRRLLRPVVGLVVLLLVLTAGVGTGFAWSRTQYYVGASSGQVAIFQGLAARPLGVPLSRVFEVQQLPVDALPPVYQEMVSSGIDVSDLDGARATVDQLRQAAQACGRTPGSGPSSSASPSGRTTPSGRATPSGKASPSGRASGRTVTPTPTATMSTTPSSTASGALPPGGRC